MAHPPSTRIRFHKLRKDGLGVKLAAERVGISERQGWRWDKGDMGAIQSKGRKAVNEEIHGDKEHRISDPLEFDKLSDTAKRCLAPDGFPLFAEKFFGLRSVPWQEKAAKLSVESILDRTERHFGVANEPPGVGKSTLWTFVIPAWLLAGGGLEDPGWGRSLRFMFGHAAKNVSIHYVQRFSRLLTSKRPFYDKQARVYAELSMPVEFGRFMPLQAMGDVTLWQDKQFIAAQIEDVDLSDKEPTCQAVSPGAEFVGDRCEYASWDDLVTTKTSARAELVAQLAEWFEKEAEPRIEPGGILWLVGQRINSMDLFRNRLDDMWVDEKGEIQRKYFHIVFPAHYEPACTGEHRQWNAEYDVAADGCLLDEVRLSWRDILKVAQRPHFRTVYQQEDSDPTQALVTKDMLEGGRAMMPNAVTGDMEQVEYPGCYNRQRGWMEIPSGVRDLVNYVTVDPAAGGKSPGSNWAIEWWACAGIDKPRYLVWATRQLMQAGELLDFDPVENKFIGWMERLQVASILAHQAIRVWVIESNSAFKHLFQYRHYQLWKERYPFVEVIPHETQKNRHDDYMGVEALLRHKYKNGLADLPRQSGDLKALTFLNAFEKELTSWPNGSTDDTVMADWMGEVNLPEILRLGHRPMRPFEIEANLPEYLMRQRREVPVRR